MNPLRRKLIWLITSRAAIIGSIFVVTLLIGRESHYIAPVTILLLIVSVLSLLYAIALKADISPTHLFRLQLVNDVVLISWLVYNTGDVESPFKSLYLIIIFAGSILPSRRGVMGVMLGSVSVFSVLTGLILTGAIERASVYGPYTRQILPQIQFDFAVAVVAMIAVALFSMSLAERQIQSDVELAVAARRLADLRAFNERIIDSMRTGLMSANLEGQIVTYNHAAEEILGHPASEVVGQPLSEYFGEIAALGKKFGNDSPAIRMLRSDAVFVRPDGVEVHLGFNLAPLKSESGEIRGLVLIFQDLTEVFKLEQEVRRQEKLAAIGVMAAGLAHEIRNPLASIRGSIQVLVGELELDEDQRKLMQIVLRESERLNRTVTDFLAFARPVPPSPSTFDLGQLIADAVLLLRNSPEVTPQHQIVESYPKGGARFVSDANQIRQIFWNLARNGLAAMANGGRLTVQVDPGHTDGYILTIEDEGVGMAPEQMNRLFVPFSSSSPKGTGLGMAIVYQLVTEHGGHIDVESTPGKGTRVRVFLPSLPAQRPVGPSASVPAEDRGLNLLPAGAATMGDARKS